MPNARIMAHSRGLRAIAILLVIGLFTTAPAAQAGILDTIKGFFGKASDTVKGFFSGGGEKEFVKLLEQVAQSQATLSEKQTNLQGYYNNKGQAGIKPNDPAINERLNDIAQTSRQNEALYLSLLKARDELVKGKKDISKYQQVLTQITEKQNQIEQQYQEIQNFNKGLGMFTPPATIASAGGASAGALAAGGAIDWRNPAVQGYIDEWLAGVQLTEWGVYIAPGAVAAGPPDHGSKQRHEWVWENLNSKSADSNITLGDYVRARMGGKSVQIVLNRPEPTGRPSSGAVIAAVSSSSNSNSSNANTGSQVEKAAPVQTASSGAEPVGELKDVIDQERSLVASIAKMNQQGQGNSEASRALYESLKAIQTRKNQLLGQQTGGAAGAITTAR